MDVVFEQPWSSGLSTFDHPYRTPDSTTASQELFATTTGSHSNTADITGSVLEIRLVDVLYTLLITFRLLCCME